MNLANTFEQEKATNKAARLAERLLRLDLVIPDEPDHLPFGPSGRASLFHLLFELSKRTSVIIASNLSFNE